MTPSIPMLISYYIINTAGYLLLLLQRHDCILTIAREKGARGEYGVGRAGYPLGGRGRVKRQISVQANNNNTAS